MLLRQKNFLWILKTRFINSELVLKHIRNTFGTLTLNTTCLEKGINPSSFTSNILSQCIALLKIKHTFFSCYGVWQALIISMGAHHSPSNLSLITKLNKRVNQDNRDVLVKESYCGQTTKSNIVRFRNATVHKSGRNFGPFEELPPKHRVTKRTCTFRRKTAKWSKHTKKFIYYCFLLFWYNVG